MDALAATKSEARAQLAANTHTKDANFADAQDDLAQAQAAAENHCRSLSIRVEGRFHKMFSYCIEDVEKHAIDNCQFSIVCFAPRALLRSTCM